MAESKKRDFIAVPVPGYSLFQIKYETGGGQLPDKLSGRYTSPGKALKAIEEYKRNLSTKKLSNTTKVASKVEENA